MSSTGGGLRRRRVISWAGATVVLLTAGAWFQLSRTDPEEVSQAEYRRLATTFEGGAFTTVPGTRTVVVLPEGDALMGVIRDRMTAPFGTGGRAEAQGAYDSRTGEIRISGDRARLEATFPEWLQPVFVGTLRHAYGHAFIEDYFATHGFTLEGEAFLAYTETGFQPDASAYPDDIRPVMEEFDALPVDVYDEPQYAATFAEYMAESYRRFIEGEPVPPKTEVFLKAQATTH